jgi:hypothetical protein
MPGGYAEVEHCHTYHAAVASLHFRCPDFNHLNCYQRAKALGWPGAFTPEAAEVFNGRIINNIFARIIIITTICRQKQQLPRRQAKSKKSIPDKYSPISGRKCQPCNGGIPQYRGAVLLHHCDHHGQC